MGYTTLTYEQKLEALSLKYYQYFNWEPKKGDYYTTCRNDLELYQIVEEDEEYFYTVYTFVPNCEKTQWAKNKFLQEFGERRVYVPYFILKR